MSNETKRDVFEDALRALEEFGEQGSSWEMAYDDLSVRYADALPDDLPVIPKAMDADEYETTFGPVEEDTDKHVMSLSVNESTYQIIKRIAAENRTTMSQVINDWAKNN